MIYIIALLTLVAFGEAALLFSGSALLKEHRAEWKRMWDYVRELEQDKRELTESLCRAQGKPFIPHRDGSPLKPSPGWFDAKPKIEFTDKSA